MRRLAEQGKAIAPASGTAQLPLWPETVRAIPNGFLRSALFGAIAKGKRRLWEAERISALAGVELTYTGIRLDQGDLDVYESVLHAVREQALGARCKVTSYRLLRLMGKTDTGKNRTTLHKRLVRLRATAIEIKQGPYVYVGGLIDAALKDEMTHGWVIELNPGLAKLFAFDQFTRVEWAVRGALSGHLLAQWLYGFYASHARPYSLKVVTLHRLCGSECQRMDHFREKLRKALDEVANACNARGQGFGYAIRGDLVHIDKAPASTKPRSRNPRRETVITTPASIDITAPSARLLDSVRHTLHPES